MAIVNVTMTVRFDQEQGYSSTNPRVTMSPATVTLYPGDVLRVTLAGDLGAQENVNPFNVYGWDSGIWSNPATESGWWGKVFDKTVRADTVLNTNDGLGLDLWIGGTNYYREPPFTSIYISEPVDNVPNQFSLGPDLGGFIPGDSFSLSTFTVSGINSSTPISLTWSGGGSASFSKNGSGSFTSSTVNNGDVIRVYGNVTGDYSSSNTATININGVTDSVTLTTTSTPPADETIYFAHGTNVSLNSIKAFFGGTLLPPNAPANNLAAYRRGGTYVPDITPNNAIPTTVAPGTPISLNQFRGAATVLNFTNYPDSVVKNIPNGTTTSSITWAVSGAGADSIFDVGYGPGMKGAALFSYSISQDSGEGLSTGVSMAVESGSPGTPTLHNTWVRLTATSSVGTIFTGTLTISATYGGKTVSRTCRYRFNFFGM